MARQLVGRGILAGLLAALAAALFARAFGEPAIELALVFEKTHAARDAVHHAPETVSRATQASLGRLLGLGTYGAALGALFAIAFSIASGRVGMIDTRSLALLLSIGGFVAVALVPALKYPPTPPGMGGHDTIDVRTAAYFAITALSVACLTASVVLGLRIGRTRNRIDATLVTIGVYAASVYAAQFLLPVADKVPADFPASVLWDFRIASIGTQLTLWATLGAAFGLLARPLVKDAFDGAQRARPNKL